MKTGFVVLSLCLSTFVAACARAPEYIAPRFYSYETYKDFSCIELSNELHGLRLSYDQVAAQQTAARENDMLGGWLLFIPVWSDISDARRQDDVADVKGRIDAVRQAMHFKKCEAPAAKYQVD